MPTNVKLAALSLVMLICAMNALAAQEGTWPPPNYLRPGVYGVIRDSAGQTVGRMGLTVEGQIGLGWSGPDGRYLLFDLKPGTRVVSFYCPTTRRLRGRKIAERSVEVSAATDSAVNFTIDAAGCSEPPLHSWGGMFRGHYTPGFESSDFEPCKPFEDLRNTTFADQDQEAWVSFDRRALAQWEQKEPARNDEQYPRFYVRWRASVTGPGSYGHMGVGLYEMTVHEILELRRARDGDCR